jgi:phosphoglycolate phosphatase-like HAD superfamily hydrolase
LARCRAAGLAVARAAHIRSIDYANEPEKRERLMDAGADTVIDTMGTVTSVLLKDDKYDADKAETC